MNKINKRKLLTIMAISKGYCSSMANEWTVFERLDNENIWSESTTSVTKTSQNELVLSIFFC